MNTFYFGLYCIAVFILSMISVKKYLKVESIEPEGNWAISDDTPGIYSILIAVLTIVIGGAGYTKAGWLGLLGASAGFFIAINYIANKLRNGIL